MRKTREILRLGSITVFLAGLHSASAIAGEIEAGDQQALANAVFAARPGATIVLANGTWRDASIFFAARGEPGRPITLRAANPGKVIATARSRQSRTSHARTSTAITRS
jgi:poly(beta-D-mannuronate) lyase